MGFHPSRNVFNLRHAQRVVMPRVILKLRQLSLCPAFVAGVWPDHNAFDAVHGEVVSPGNKEVALTSPSDHPALNHDTQGTLCFLGFNVVGVEDLLG